MDRYAQCQIEYEKGGYEQAWIPIKFAKVGILIVIGKNKVNGVRARVASVGIKTGRDMAKYTKDWSKAHKRTDI